MALRNRTTFVLVGVPALLCFSFACATSDDVAAGSRAPDEEGASLLDGGAERGDVSVADASTEDVDAGRSVCSKDGFCFTTVPIPKPLVAVSAASVDDAWMLAESSAVLLHWDGSSLKQRYEYAGTSPGSITFVSLWAEKKDDVWALANGSDGRFVLVRYSSPGPGEPPTFRELPTDVASKVVSAVWGTPDGDALWVATQGNSLLRIREESGAAIVDTFAPPNGSYYWMGIWGFGPNDIYLAGGDPSRGVIVHYDGAEWSVFQTNTALVSSLRGTPPGGERQLWYHHASPQPSGNTTQTSLVPVTADGGLGPPIYTHLMNPGPACSSRIGHASSSTAWFSDGVLLCRWDGDFEPVSTSLDGRLVVDSVNAIWSSDRDDVWVVGAAVTSGGMPAKGFAARRTAATSKGGQ